MPAQLLWSRQQLTLQVGETKDVDTGINQGTLAGLPPLGVSGTAAPAAGTLPASRIQVIPMAPLSKWSDGNIINGEPYWNTTTGTVHVEFSNTGGSSVYFNVLFWDPHSMIGPGDAAVYGAPANPNPPTITTGIQIPPVPASIGGEPGALPGDQMHIGVNPLSSDVTDVSIGGTDTSFTPDPVDGPLVTLPTPTANDTTVCVTVPPWSEVCGTGSFVWSRWRAIAADGNAAWEAEGRIQCNSFLLTTGPNTGSVLVFGGSSIGAGADDKICYLYNPVTFLWSATGAMAVARRTCAPCMLADGKILACGGYDYDTGLVTDTAEVYDPTTGLWTTVGNMTIVRNIHTAILLTVGPNAGKVLVMGGQNDALVETNTSELYDPVATTFGAGPAMAVVMSGQSAVRLGDVLTISGNVGQPAYGTTNRYDAALNTWAVKATQNTDRIGVTARVKLLPSGNVILVGGSIDGVTQLADCEIYNPGANTWTTVAALNQACQIPQLFLLSTGDVMCSGGIDGFSISQCLIYNEAGDAWAAPPGIYDTTRRYSNTPSGCWDPGYPVLAGDVCLAVSGLDNGTISNYVEMFRLNPV